MTFASRLLPLLWLVSSVCCGAASPGQAEIGDAAADSAYLMQEVIIHGLRSGTAISMTAEFNSEVLERIGNASVTDVLRNNPGISVTTGAKAEADTRIRGIPGRDVLVLVDGRPLNPGYYGRVDLSILPVGNVASIKVHKGPAAAAFGPNALGGVIEIATNNGATRARTLLQTEIGDYEYRRLALSHSRSLRRLNFALSGYENSRAGFALSRDFERTSIENGGQRDRSAFHKQGGSVALSYPASGNAEYKLSAGYHVADRQIPSTVYSWDSPTYREFPLYNRFESALRGVWKLTTVSELNANLFLDTYQDRLRDYAGPELTAEQLVRDSKLENWTTGASASYSAAAGRHRLQGGISIKRDLTNKQPAAAEPWVTYYSYTSSVYVQDNFLAKDFPDVTAGLSFSRLNLETASSQFGCLNPSVSVTESLPLGTQGYASYARANRFPTLHQLYSTDTGNPKLRPEIADKFEVGVQKPLAMKSQTLSGMLEIAFFHNELHDLIYRSSRDRQYLNVERGVLRGMEAELAVSASGLARAELGYTRIGQVATTDELLENVSPNRFRGMITGEILFGLELSYELNIFDNRSTSIESRVLPAYEVHHLTLSRKLKGESRLSLRCENLTDTMYHEELGYPAPGRQVIGGLSLSM